MFSVPFLWVLDSDQGQIGGRGILNLEDLEATKIRRNEDKTSVVAIALVFRSQATEHTCQGKILAGIRRGMLRSKTDGGWRVFSPSWLVSLM